MPPDATKQDAEQTPPAAPPAAQQAAVESPKVSTNDLPPEALSQRLTREREKATKEARSQLLQELGVTDPTEAKTAIEAAAARREAEKTQAEKLAALEAKHATAETRKSQLESIISQRYETESARLTEAQRAAVTAIAGDDKALALRTIDTLSATWAATQPVAPPAATQAITHPAAPAAQDTAPGKTAPPEGKTSPPDHKAVWQAMNKTNPFRAGEYLRRHRADIFPSQ